MGASGLKLENSFAKLSVGAYVLELKGTLLAPPVIKELPREENFLF